MSIFHHNLKYWYSKLVYSLSYFLKRNRPRSSATEAKTFNGTPDVLRFGWVPPLETMEAAKLSHRQLKAAVPLFLGDLQRHCADSDSEAVKQTLEKLRSSFYDFQKSHDAYRNMLMQDNALAGSDIDARGDWNSKVVANHSDGMAAAITCLNIAVSDDAPGPCKGTRDMHAELIDMFFMPKTELYVFNGDPFEFQSSLAVFNEPVGCRNIDDHVKLTRLLQYTSGPLKSMIKSCSLFGGKEDFQQARSILKARFCDSHLTSERITVGVNLCQQIRHTAVCWWISWEFACIV